MNSLPNKPRIGFSIWCVGGPLDGECRDYDGADSYVTVGGHAYRLAPNAWGGWLWRYDGNAR